MIPDSVEYEVLKRSPHGSMSDPKYSAIRLILKSRWFPYLMLLLLQSRVLFGIWDGKDITYGDTASHFLKAYRWYTEGHIDPVQSPLYSIFLGSFLHLTHNLEQLILLHRLAIVFIAGILVLSVLRSLLPTALAWLIASWWVVLPINFNSLYEIHLFATLPLLAMWLLLTYRSSWGNGAALGLLIAAVLFLRNEMAPAILVLVPACIFSEWKRVKHTNQSWQLYGPRIFGAYGLPLAIVAALSLYILTHSVIPLAHLTDRIEAKNAFNIGQGFAFGYQQRHPEWTKNYWTEYRGLMKEHFGKEDVTLWELIRLNHEAAFEHFRWNWRLAPAGIQLLLFNATSSQGNPDYIPVLNGRYWVLFPTTALLAIWVAGLVTLLKRRHFWWRAWLKKRAMLWLGMLAVVACAPIIISSMRPRPSFLLSLSVPLMAWTGTCLFVLLRRTSVARCANWWLPYAMVSLITLTPPYFVYSTHPPPRPLLTLLQRTAPFVEVFTNPLPIVFPQPFAAEIRMYVGKNRAKTLDYKLLTTDWSQSISMKCFLNGHNVNAIYLDEELLVWLESARPNEWHNFRFSATEWKLLGSGATPGDRWFMFARSI